MDKTIVIDNRTTRFSTVVGTAVDVYRSIPTNEFLDQIQGVDVILPEDTKYFNKMYHNQYLVVIEKPPQLRSLLIEIALGYRWTQFVHWASQNKVNEAVDYIKDKFKRTRFPYGQYRFQVMQPYMVYTMFADLKNNGCRFSVTVRNKPLTKMNDMLYLAPFYNISSRTNVCMDNRKLEWSSKMSLRGMTNFMITNFWSSWFNSDYNGNIKSYKDVPEYSNVFIWDFLSNNYPDKMFEAKMIRYKTIEKVIADEKRFYTRALAGNQIQRFHRLLKPEARVVKKKKAKKKLP